MGQIDRPQGVPINNLEPWQIIKVAEKLALGRALATINSPDDPAEDDFYELLSAIQDSCKIDEEVLEDSWAYSQVTNAGGSWSLDAYDDEAEADNKIETEAYIAASIKARVEFELAEYTRVSDKCYQDMARNICYVVRNEFYPDSFE